MARFGTHLFVGTVGGIGLGIAAYKLFSLPAESAILVGGVCAAGAVLPDVDSNTGTALREGLAFAASLASVCVAGLVSQLGWNADRVILAGITGYFLVRFGIAEVIRLTTKHRGMFHSLPAAVIAAELTFLITVGWPATERLIKAGAVLTGYMSHLLLDEFSALIPGQGRLGPSRALGSACKVFGHNAAANLITYALLLVLTYLCVYKADVIRLLFWPN